jgi:hypothetical protein
LESNFNQLGWGAGGSYQMCQTKIESSAACACVGVPIKRGHAGACFAPGPCPAVIKRRPCTSMPSTSPSCTPVLAVFWLSPCRSPCANVHYLPVHSSMRNSGARGLGRYARATQAERPTQLRFGVRAPKNAPEDFNRSDQTNKFSFNSKVKGVLRRTTSLCTTRCRSRGRSRASVASRGRYE